MNIDHDTDELGERAIVEIGGHHIHLYETDEGDVRIYINDHANLKLKGDPKDRPTLVVDSEEFPTNLDVRDNEKAFDVRLNYLHRDRDY